jgi:hypothetical protein
MWDDGLVQVCVCESVCLCVIHVWCACIRAYVCVFVCNTCVYGCAFFVCLTMGGTMSCGTMVWCRCVYVNMCCVCACSCAYFVPMCVYVYSMYVCIVCLCV